MEALRAKQKKRKKAEDFTEGKRRERSLDREKASEIEAPANQRERKRNTQAASPA